MPRDLFWLFWICLVASAACGAFVYILVWRRQLWLRLLDAEESLWLRFGISKGGFSRRFGESRFFTISFVVFAVIFLLLAGACVGVYFYLRHRVERG
jgi:L-asparagine transporter-like permease